LASSGGGIRTRDLRVAGISGFPYPLSQAPRRAISGALVWRRRHRRATFRGDDGEPAIDRTSMRRSMSRSAGFVAAAYAFAVAMLGTTLPTPLYPSYQEQWGFSDLTITVIFATYAIGVIAALLLLGRLSDLVGRRRALLPGLAFAALSAVAFLLAHGIGLLFVGRVFSGLSAGIFTGTATATLLDLAGPRARGRATLVATVVSMAGLACGPLLAGLLSEFAGSPLRLVFWVDLALLIPAAALVWAMPETVAAEGKARLRPRRLRIPDQVRPVFVRVGLATFAGFAVLGLFSAVAPEFLGQILEVKSHATLGVVVAGVFASSIVGQTLLQRVAGSKALPVGCVALAAGMGLVAQALIAESLALLIAGGVVAAVGQGLSFRAGLTAVNEASPPERRAEVASSFFVVGYLGVSVPVVGVGLLAELVSLRVAGLVFTGLVALLALAALYLLAGRSTARRRRRLRLRPVEVRQ
jgi:MFS family permease